MNICLRQLAIATAQLLLIVQPVSATGFDFAILGDRTGQAVPGIYERVCAEVASRHPAFIINVGDTIQGLDDATATAEWLAMRPVWKTFGDIPFYLVPGNHDIWSAHSENVWRKQTGRDPQYSVDFQGMHIVVLDNSRTDDLAPAQIAFLERDLAAHRQAATKMVVFHRPFWLLPVKFRNGDFGLHRIAHQNGVALVVSGHSHWFDRSEYEGVQYVMVGSSGGSLTHGKGLLPSPPPEGAYFGYAWVHVEPGASPESRCALEFKRLQIQSDLGK